MKSYRGRRFNPRAKVRVYRNLNRKGQWYSVMQGGRVVGHTQFILLHGGPGVMDGVDLIVSKSGHERYLKTKTKNVHAFVEGYISYTWMFFMERGLKLSHRAGYLASEGHFWVDISSDWMDPFGEYPVTRFGMKTALAVLLSEEGMSVDEPDIFVIKDKK